MGSSHMSVLLSMPVIVQPGERAECGKPMMRLKDDGLASHMALVQWRVQLLAQGYWEVKAAVESGAKENAIAGMPMSRICRLSVGKRRELIEKVHAEVEAQLSGAAGG